MTKPFSMVLLGRRVTALLRRSGRGGLPCRAAFGEVTVDFSGYAAWDKDGKIDITPKEIDLLISRAAALLGHAVNCALQPDFSPELLLELARQ